MDHNQNLHEEFVAEAREHLEIMETGLLALESQGVTADSELIAKIFRSIHSIKGAAGFLGLVRINELAHVMETILDMMRSGAIKPESRYTDGLLAGLDMLRTLIDDADQSNGVDIQAIVNRLASLIGKATSPRVKQEMETKVALADRQGEDLDLAISEYSLKSIPSGYSELFLLKFDLLELGRRGMTPVALVRELLATGQIIDARIATPADSLDRDLAEMPLFYNVLYATIFERSMVMHLTGLAEERIISVQPGATSSPAPPEEPPAQTSAAADPEPPLPLAVAPPLPPGGENPAVAAKASETIRIQVNILDRLMALAGELVLVRNRNLMSVNRNDLVAFGISKRLDIVTSELQEAIMQTRMQPLANVFGKLTRIVRDLSKKLDKQMTLVVSGDEVELDKTILEALADPLTHLIRNCCDHGIETVEQRLAAGKPAGGTITVTACHEAGQINIRIVDDGKGIDGEAIKRKALANGFKSAEELAAMGEKETISLILLPGLSTAETVSDVSGRGVGMDVVKTSIEQFGGSLELASTLGAGTSVHLRLPLTLAIIPSLIVVEGDYRYAIPQVNLEELVCLYDEEVYTRIECAGDQEVFRLRDTLLPMVRLNEVLAQPEPFTLADRAAITEEYSQLAKAAAAGTVTLPESLTFVVVKVGSERFGLIVDRVLGTEEIVVKPMHPALKGLTAYSGATVMGDGKVALILDIEGIARHAAMESTESGSGARHGVEGESERQNVLLFKNGEREQFAVSLPLIKRVEHFAADRIELVGDKEYVTIDGVSTLVLRLDRVLKVTPAPQQEAYYLLLPKHIKRSFGILVAKLIDVVETSLTLNEESYSAEGVLGTAIVLEQMTLFLDVYRLIEEAEPEWFAERRLASGVGTERRRVLLVEDTPFFLRLVKGYLEADNYEVVTAANGQLALELLAHAPVDLIVSDLEMPVLDGWGFLRAVRARPEFGQIPAMALTALDAERDRSRAEQAGFDAYEVKIDRERLLTVVARLLQQGRTAL